MVPQSYQEMAGRYAQAGLATGQCQVERGGGAQPQGLARRPEDDSCEVHYVPEVVFVFEQFSLIDAESYQRNYSRKSGQALARGYYVVTWPGGRNGSTFGDEAQFHGPYRTRKDAENSPAMIHAVKLPKHPHYLAALAGLATKGTSPARKIGQPQQA